MYKFRLQIIYKYKLNNFKIFNYSYNFFIINNKNNFLKHGKITKEELIEDIDGDEYEEE